jgi:hypothetical protein
MRTDGHVAMRIRTLSYMIAIVVAPTSFPAAAQVATAPAAMRALKINYGDRALTVSPADIAALPHRNVRVAEDTGDSVTVSGVSLWDVLQKVGIPSAQASGRQRAATFLRLQGADAQVAVVALVEIDPGFSRRIALVADRRDGHPLDETEGPLRVVIPDDQRHARWIRGLASITVTTASP